MKKTICIVLSLLVCIFIFTGCTKDYVYLLDSATEVKLSFDASGGYEFSPEDDTFFIYKDEEAVVKGAFMTKENAEIFIDSMDTLEDITLVDKGTESRGKVNVEYAKYIYQQDDYVEYIIVATYNTCDYGVTFSSTTSMEEASNAFDRITISLME